MPNTPDETRPDQLHRKPRTIEPLPRHEEAHAALQRRRVPALPRQQAQQRPGRLHDAGSALAEAFCLEVGG